MIYMYIYTALDRFMQSIVLYDIGGQIMSILKVLNCLEFFENTQSSDTPHITNTTLHYL